MKKLSVMTAFAFAMLACSNASAMERTVTLAIENMYCAVCPQIVQASLRAVPGVKRAIVSYKEKTAVVTYDDASADLRALTAATGNAGYPSAPKS
jgi:mercuric ion binding protein